MTSIRSMPCSACPYRSDVASGVWAHDEYDKLRDYDLPTSDQPWAVFACHATPEHYCNGWAVVHNNRGHAHELMALRVSTRWDGVMPEASVPMFASGNDAANHGQADVAEPSPKARAIVERLTRKYPRLETS